MYTVNFLYERLPYLHFAHQYSEHSMNGPASGLLFALTPTTCLILGNYFYINFILCLLLVYAYLLCVVFMSTFSIANSISV